MKKFEIQKDFFFDAAHSLKSVSAKHKCSQIHGHSFKVVLSVEGPLDKKYGWVMDFGEISRIVQPCIDKFDHRYLNDIEGLSNPTSENIAIFIWNELKPQLPLLKSIEVHESDTSRCIFRG